tara:strand:+ start:541 stop:1587 length:1047 start_codon:yes stop_codon:yes gene_type:complete
MSKKIYNVAVLGASGYTGLEIIRLLIKSNNNYKILVLTAETKAGMEVSDIFPHLRAYDLPKLIKINEVNFDKIDAVISCLPHGKSHKIVASIPNHIKIIDLSADFRFSDTSLYEKTYDSKHIEKQLQKEVVYGLTELNRVEIKNSRIVANPGCYPTSALLPLIPLVNNGIIDPMNIIIDSKSGVSGAGRTHKDYLLFGEISEGFMAYGLPNHRHKPEINFQLSRIIKSDINVTFTPHLLPIKRGILSTIYIKIKGNYGIEDLKNCLDNKYKNEAFVNFYDNYIPNIHDVRGTNLCNIGVVYDGNSNTCIIISVIDNLLKGASGQALQNLNLMFDIEETHGLINVPMFL